MSCGCNNNSNGSPFGYSPYGSTCAPELPYPQVSAESVPSLISNLTQALYGTYGSAYGIQKSVVNGRIKWTIPCDPNSTATITGIPRQTGEGLLCYILRASNFLISSGGSLQIAGSPVYYISARTDGNAGNGTISNPFDGSTQTKFDAIFANPNTTSCKIAQNCLVKILEGTYSSNGIILPNGTSLIGDGQNTTKIRLNARSADRGGVLTILIAAFGDNITISGLTLDGNWQNLRQANSMIQLITISGSGTGASALSNNSKVTNCNIINFGGDVTLGVEVFPVFITGTNALIDNCTASGLQNNIGQDGCYATIFTIGGNAWDGANRYYGSGKITNNYVLGNGPTKGGFGVCCGANFDGVEISGNTFENLGQGVHGDSWQNLNLTIKNNKFINCQRAIGIDYGGSDSLTGCVIDSNVFYLCNQENSLGNNGVSLFASSVKNLEIKNNVLRNYKDIEPQECGYFTIAYQACSNVYVHDNIIYQNVGSNNCVYAEQVVKEYNNTDEMGVQRFDISLSSSSISVKANGMAPWWTSDIPYPANSYVYYDGNTYKNLTNSTIAAHLSSPTSNASWTLSTSLNGGDFINGLSLVNALKASRGATPQGIQKSPQNRFTIELEAGVYSIPSESNLTNVPSFTTIKGNSSSKATIVKSVNGTAFDLAYNGPDFITFENITIMGSGASGVGLDPSGSLINFSNWSSSVTYPVPSSSNGGYVYYSNTLYQNLSGSSIASGGSNPSLGAPWTAVPTWVSGTYANYTLVSYNGIVYQNKTGSPIVAGVAPNAVGSTWTIYTDWLAATTYVSSALAFYLGKVYQNTYPSSISGSLTPDSIASYWSRYTNSNVEFNNVFFTTENSGKIIPSSGVALGGTLKNCTSDAPFSNNAFTGNAINCVFESGLEIVIVGNLINCIINGRLGDDTTTGYIKNCIINTSGMPLGGEHGFSGTLDGCELVNVWIKPSSTGTAQIINTSNIFNSANTLSNTYSLDGTGSVSLINYYSNLPSNPTLTVSYLGAGNYVTATGTSTSLATGTPANITASTISLTAGEWDISADVNFVATGATTTLAGPFIGSISTTSATPVANQQFQFPVVATTSTYNITGAVPTTRLVLTSTTSVYLVAQATFTAGSVATTGVIRARQIH